MPKDIDADLGSALPSGQDPTGGPPKQQSEPPVEQPVRAPESGDPLEGKPNEGRFVVSANEALDELFKKSQVKEDEVGEPDPPKEDSTSSKQDDSRDDEEAAKAAEVAKAASSDDLDKIVFPENASKSAAESFEALKKASRDRIAAAEERAKQVEKEAEELKSKLGGKSPEDLIQQVTKLEEEVGELRNFKKVLDVENSPEFEVFDKRITRSSESILEKLAEWGMEKENVDKVRQAGVTKVNWQKIFEHTTPAQKSFIERRLLDIENAELEKTDAVKDAKANADDFLKKQAKQSELSAQAAATARKETVKELRETARWLQYPTLNPDATEEEKKAFNSDLPNAKKFVDSLNQKIDAAISDTSPETHATLAFGNAMSFYLSAHVGFLQRELKAAQDERDGVAKELDKIKKASRARKPGSAHLEPNERRASDVSEHKPGLRTEDALDALFAQAQASKS